MGTQFWWFYDVIAAAILLICIFVGGKKGMVKSAVIAAGCALSALISFGISGSIADGLYKGSIHDANIKKFIKDIDGYTFTSKYREYLESMGYNITVGAEKLSKIFTEEEDIDEALVKYINNINARKVEENETVLLEKIREGYAVVIGDMVGNTFDKYAAERTAEEIRKDSSGMQELLPIMVNAENLRPAVTYILENYTSKAYKTEFGLGAFAILFVLIMIAAACCANAFVGRKNEVTISMTSHIIGGILGIVTGIAVILAAAALIRLWAVMGSNEMLFFNNEAIDKSYVFKYFYETVSKI